MARSCDVLLDRRPKEHVGKIIRFLVNEGVLDDYIREDLKRRYL